MKTPKLEVVTLSDTHNKLSLIEVPDGDILIHAGDFCGNGSREEWEQFLEEFSELPHKHKLFIFGNHDVRNPTWVPEIRSKAKDLDITLLLDEMIEVEGLKIYGSPFTPTFGNWNWMKDRGVEIKKVWDKIPKGLDILVTHGPPFGILDVSVYSNTNVGCSDLLKAVEEKTPKNHLFGHIHNWGSMNKKVGETTFYNVVVCNEQYRPVNKVTVFKI